MAIEGPLRELGIHDVFQLLDLSRKTGVLRVTSALRDNEGAVYFDAGRVTAATVKSNPHPLGQLLVKSGKVTERDLERARELQGERGGTARVADLLVEIGALNPRELERQVRLQIEAVVFELMGWREGFFSFEEQDATLAPGDASARISSEALLMEGARRIDEWSRIADRVPNLDVVPVLATVGDEHEASLDLLPHEWEVLAAIDGQANLRAIAADLARSEFDVAKIAYGLLCTGVVDLRAPARDVVALGAEEAHPHVMRSSILLGEGRVDEALSSARAAVAADASSAAARVAAARALVRLGRDGDAFEELQRAAELAPADPDVQLELGFASARRGLLGEAGASWRRFLAAMPGAPQAARVRAALDAVFTLERELKAHAGV